mmetsp:Transcript_34051/g.54945  ORF Transcript_34051/g.54945 Transcript_34051/m.54945 type:complete len:88 (+) Transcript_34051:295-558(+)
MTCLSFKEARGCHAERVTGGQKDREIQETDRHRGKMREREKQRDKRTHTRTCMHAGTHTYKHTRETTHKNEKALVGGGASFCRKQNV